MDVLSDVLRSLHFKSVVYFRSAFVGPWGMDMSSVPFAQFHIVVAGECLVGDEKSDQVLSLQQGDVVILPHGDSHWLADTRDSHRAAGLDVLHQITHGEIPGGVDGSRTTLICGHFELNPEFRHPILTTLPSIMRVRPDSPSRLSRLELLTEIISSELAGSAPGSEIIATKLAETIFIQVLRDYYESTASLGFVGALTDPIVGQVLELMHQAPSRNWTIASFAREVGLSRSALADRFRNTVGTTVISYLTDWRMHCARIMLRTSGLTQIEIAERSGYSSEAAFSRAFKKKYKLTPGKVRRQSN